VVYGLWGIFVLIPLLRAYVIPPLQAVLGWTPLFSGTFFGNSMLAAGMILAIMILPYISSVSREVLAAVPPSQREAALALGATRWEAVWSAVLPYGRAGVLGAIVLGLGRALGETMAVVMVIGNRHDLSVSLVEPGITMAAVIANEFNEAAGLLARLLVWRVARGSAVGSRAI
jgi:phosphate transport system permease protein